MDEPSETIIQATPGYYLIIIPDEKDERSKIASGELSPLRLPIIAWRVSRLQRVDGSLFTSVDPIYPDGELEQEYAIQTPDGSIEHPQGTFINITTFMKSMLG